MSGLASNTLIASNWISAHSALAANIFLLLWEFGRLGEVNLGARRRTLFVVFTKDWRSFNITRNS